MRSNKKLSETTELIAQGADGEALCAALRAIDIDVPTSLKVRTKRHTEIWTVARLLSTLAAADRLSYPLTANRRDKPDIVLTCGEHEIGVEITQSTSPQFAAYCALAEREFPDALLEPAHFHWDAPRMSADDMRAILRQSELTSDGWIGDHPEREWACFIRDSWKTKLAKLRQADFAKYTHNWLAIYDNLPLDFIDLQTALEYLRPSILEFWTQSPGFDAVFVEHKKTIVALTTDGVDQLALNELWA